MAFPADHQVCPKCGQPARAEGQSCSYCGAGSRSSLASEPRGIELDLALIGSVLLLPVAWAGILLVVLGAELARGVGFWYVSVAIIGVGVFAWAVRGWFFIGLALARGTASAGDRSGSTPDQAAAVCPRACAELHVGQLGVGAVAVLAGAIVMASAFTGEIGHEIRINVALLAVGVTITFSGVALCVGAGRRMGPS